MPRVGATASVKAAVTRCSRRIDPRGGGPDELAARSLKTTLAAIAHTTPTARIATSSPRRSTVAKGSATAATMTTDSTPSARSISTDAVDSARCTL